MNPIPPLMHAIGYIKSRLAEASTWIAVGATVAAVSQLTPPWSYVGLACGIMAAMVPNQQRCDKQ